jgi:tetratricopeptide (TPR) repeat protein
MSSKQHLMALIQSAHWAEAREAGRELCRTQDSDPEAWYLLSAIHGQLGDWPECERCSEKAAMLAPGVSAAHFNLGVARLRQRKAGATASLRTTLSLQPDHPAARDLLKEACFTEGLLLAEAGNLDGAMQFLASALPDTDSAKIRMLLGEICSKTRRRDLAVTHYRRACELEPGNAAAHACLADAMLLGDPSRPLREEALEHLRTAVRLDPDYIAARNNLASALHMLGRHEEAIAEYAAVLERSPGHPASILGMVRTHESMGQVGKAETILRPWLDRAASVPELALAYGIMAPHLGEQKAAIDALRSVMTQATCERETERVACFQLGELLDGEGSYDEAFQYFQRAHTLHPFPYDHAGQARRFDVLIDFFSKDRLPRLPRAGNRSKLPVFIVGMPRSGTTLVETILASHPLVHGAGELDDVFQMRQEIGRASGTGKRYPHYLESVSAKVLDPFAERHLKKLAALAAPGIARVTDKMPQNFVQLGLIELLFPGARVIHCVRDPLDTCLSIYSHPFIQHHAYATDLTNLGHYYREYLRLMAHWRAVLRIPLLEVRYEDLIERPEENVRRLIEFCELPWDDRCLRHHESERFANTFSYNQVRQPIYKTSMAKWKRYEKHLGPLIAALGDATGPRSATP